jgi:hypothetical protein
MSSLLVLMTAYRLSGEVMKQAAIKILLRSPLYRALSGKREQKGHSISPSSFCPQRAHTIMPRASSISSLIIL